MFPIKEPHAFPSTLEGVVPGEKTFVLGLTKREYYAAQVIGHLMPMPYNTPMEVAQAAVRYADALISALERR